MSSFLTQTTFNSQFLLLAALVLVGFCLDLGFAHSHHHDHHQCGGHGHDHDHHHDEDVKEKRMLLPEELAEEEDLKLYGFGYPHDYDHHHHLHDIVATELSGLALWLNALGCSFLVSMASLICLIILPVIFVQGKPSKGVVDSLALFGAGAMLGDAFLHQLPHAFGGEHSHSHGNHADHDHDASSGHGQSHSHSLSDLSTGMSILAGIVLFLLVEKIVRYVEENSGGASSLTHGHHHHTHNSKKKLKDDNNSSSESLNAKEQKFLDKGKESDQASRDSLKEDNPAQSKSSLRKRTGSNATKGDNLEASAVNSSKDNIESSHVKEPVRSSSLVFGYLNLFSDGVHNFTDGMALGSAFLLYGSVGGWSRTLFLLAHELPQEIGDFGILIRSGFSIPKALFFNFLSALVALVGTALALLWGKDPGQSSLIEGFTAGGFIYIAIAGVLAETNNSGKTTLRNTATQIISLTMGMAVALGISLVE